MTSNGVIVLIDDKPYFVDFLAMVLREEGYTVSVAYNGETGLELIESQRPDLVILDLMLPDMSGMALLTVLRQSRFIHIPVILISIYAIAESNHNNVRAAAILTKPFELDELFRCVARHIRAPLPFRPSHAPTLSIIPSSARNLPARRSLPSRNPLPSYTPLPVERNSVRPARQAPINLLPLVHPTGLALSLPTLERIVATLDGATPLARQTPHERWRYRFAWDSTVLVVIGMPDRALIYGTDRAAMDRLAEVIGVRCLDTVAAAWPRVASLLGLIDTLLSRYQIDWETPWSYRPKAADSQAYRQELMALLIRLSCLAPDSARLFRQVMLRRDMPHITTWLEQLCLAYNIGRAVQEYTRHPAVTTTRQARSG